MNRLWVLDTNVLVAAVLTAQVDSPTARTLGAMLDGSLMFLLSPALLAEFDTIMRDYQARTQRPMSHVGNYFDCVKSRQLTVANPEVMHRSMSTVHAANICMWLNRDMRYDPVKEEFLNDPEANRLRTRAMREPWVI